MSLLQSLENQQMLFIATPSQAEVIFENALKNYLTDEKIKSLLGLNSSQAPAKMPPPATKAEAMKYLRISQPTLDVLINTGQIKTFNIGRHVRIEWKDIEAYISSQKS